MQSPHAAVVPVRRSTFSKMPLELLLRLANHLHSSDLFSFRLTCRSIEASLYHSFSTEFFTVRQFMLSYSSLEVLSEIAKSRLGHYLEHVIIGLDHHMLDLDYFPPNNKDELQKTSYAAGYDDQQALLDSGDAVTLLSSAFAELSQKGRGLQVVGIRDYYSRARSARDGDGAEWRSYGAHTGLLQTGSRLVWHGHDYRSLDWRASMLGTKAFAKQVFRIILLALGKCTTSPLPAIEVLAHNYAHLHPSAFAIPSQQRQILIPLLGKLERIFLPVDLRHVATSRYVTSHDTGSAITCPDNNLRLFLSYMLNLKHLRLNLSSGAQDKLFLKWLGQPADAFSKAKAPDDANASSKTITSATDGEIQKAAGYMSPYHKALPLEAGPIDLPGLIELNLGSCKVDSETLLMIAKKFATTLSRLELHRVTLVATGQGRCEWPSFLRGLRNIAGLNLTHLMIALPHQTMTSVGMSPRALPEEVQFRSLVEIGPPKSYSIAMRRSYTGIDWKNFVKELEKDMFITPSGTQLVSNSDEEMSDDDSESDADSDGDEDEGV